MLLTWPRYIFAARATPQYIWDLFINTRLVNRVWYEHKHSMQLLAILYFLFVRLDAQILTLTIGMKIILTITSGIRAFPQGHPGGDQG